MSREELHPVLREDFDRILQAMTPRFKDLAGTTMFVTGAAGFVGSYLMDFMAYANRNFLDKPCKVTGIDNMLANSRKVRAGPSTEVVIRDVVYCNETADWIVHLASIASPMYYAKYPLATIEANVNGTHKMLQRAAAGARAMVHFSSSEAYGDPPPDKIPTPETYWGHVSFTGPRSVYDESKRFSETLCQIWFREFKTPVKIARPFNVYGPGHRLEDGRIVPQLMRAVLTGEPFVVYGDGSATRSFCYVSDAIVQMFAILLDGESGEAYNLGDGKSEISILKFTGLARPLFPGLKIEMVPHHESLVDAPTRRRPDTTKILRIAPPPQVGLAEGLRRTHEWHKEQA